MEQNGSPIQRRANRDLDLATSDFVPATHKDRIDLEKIDFEFNDACKEPLELDENDFPMSMNSYNQSIGKTRLDIESMKSDKIKTDDKLNKKSKVERKPKVGTTKERNIFDNMSLQLGSVIEGSESSHSSSSDISFQEQQKAKNKVRQKKNEEKKENKKAVVEQPQGKKLEIVENAKAINSTAAPNTTLKKLETKKIEVNLESQNSMVEMQDESFSDDGSGFDENEPQSESIIAESEKKKVVDNNSQETGPN